MSTRITTTIAALVAIAATGLLGGCGAADGTGIAGASSTTTPTATTPTTTVTVTATSSVPVPTLTKPGKPNTTMSIPPPAKDPLVIPNTPKAYAQAFVTSWVDRDRARAAKLGTTAAVDAAFGSTPTKAPTFTSCEGAAGSSYCTWEGDEFTMTVRVLNEKSAQRQTQAVTEVKFAH
jgi:hypothetical protein